jgi:hypothetical protein
LDDAGASAEKKLQGFHSCLAALLEELVELQKNPPIVEFTVGGIKFTKKLIIQVAFVMGDQLSQDKLCGRKAVNSGGAGRIHRRCMCSSLKASDTCSSCKTVSKSEIDRLVDIALESAEDQKDQINNYFPNGATPRHIDDLNQYWKRRSTCARGILEKVYSTYPIRNAWSKVSFGSNKDGIYRATLDDPMHYMDSGSFLYLAQVAFLSMTEGDRLQMENIIKDLFKSKRSSVREDLPRGKFTSGFSKTTLLTAGEKIGLILALHVALGTETGNLLYNKVLGKIQQKYENLPSECGGDTIPKRGEVYFFKEIKKKRMERKIQ